MGKELNHYLVLGVDATCEDVVIHAAYKALMLKYHPDKNSNHNANYRSVAINEAYSVLGNKLSRKSYDLSLDSSDRDCHFCSGTHFSEDKSIKIRKENKLKYQVKNNPIINKMLNLALIVFALALIVIDTVWILFPTLPVINTAFYTSANASGNILYDASINIDVSNNNLLSTSQISYVNTVKVHTGRPQVYFAPFGNTERFLYSL